MKLNYKILEKTLGLVFIASAIVNGLGLGEDLGLMFNQAAISLADTRLSGLANFINNHQFAATVAICLLMAVTGFVEFIHHKAVPLAASVQIIMMLGFITFLHRSFPEIIFVDGLLIFGLAIILVHRQLAPFQQLEIKIEKT